MFFSCSQLKTRRFTAWLLLLVCTWMGTGGAVHHTEAGTARAALKAAPSLHHAAAGPSDACAACEWTQGLQGHGPPILALSLLLLSLPLRPGAALPAPIVRTLLHRPSRAPPTHCASLPPVTFLTA